MNDSLAKILTISAEALASVWHRKARNAFDIFTYGHSIPNHREQNAPWFTEELPSMKWKGRPLERSWRKLKSEDDWTLAWAHYWSYVAAKDAQGFAWARF